MKLLLSSEISELVTLSSFQKWPQVCPLPHCFPSYSDHLGKLLCSISNSLTFHCPEKLRVTCKPKYSNFWIWMKMLKPGPALVPKDSHNLFFFFFSVKCLFSYLSAPNSWLNGFRNIMLIRFLKNNLWCETFPRLLEFRKHMHVTFYSLKQKLAVWLGMACAVRCQDMLSRSFFAQCRRCLGL